MTTSDSPGRRIVRGPSQRGIVVGANASRRAACWTACGVALLIATFTAHPLGAQGAAVDAQCRSGTPNERITQDACQKAIDLFNFFAPQLGATIAGGNAVVGEHSTLRGLGHFSIGFKANAIESDLPRVDQRTPATTGVSASDYSVRKQWLGAPVVDAAVGIFRGIPFAGTYALGVDALFNVAYIPSVDKSDFALDVPDGSLKVGYGARIGLLAETFLTPGISLTWLERDLPTVNIVGRVDTDALNVRRMQVQTTAWRVVAGKNLAFVGLAIGGGQDRYDTRARAQVTINRVVPSVTSSEVTARQELTRNNVFANAALNLPALRLVLEVGRSSGGTATTYNSFAGHKASDPRDYASLGLRVNW